MNKIKRVTLSALLLVSFLGCKTPQKGIFSHTVELEPIPHTPLVPVAITKIGVWSPSVVSVILVNTNTGQIEPPPGYSHAGNGIAGNAVDAAGNFFGLREVGRGIAKSGDRTTVNQEGGGASSDSSSASESSASAEASSQSAATANLKSKVTVQNPPTKPPGNRPPSNRPPPKQDRRKW